MIDPDLIKSDYDLELLFSSVYLEHFLKSAIETGEIRTNFPIPVTGTHNLVVTLRSPNIQRNYVPNPNAFLPLVNANSFHITNTFDSNPATSGDVSDEIGITLLVFADIHDSTTGQPILVNTDLAITLNVKLTHDLEFVDDDKDWVVTNIRFNLSVIDVSGPLITTATNPPFSASLATIISSINNALPDSIPFLPFGSNSPIHKIGMRFLHGDGINTQNAIGIYVNLIIRRSAAPWDRPSYRNRLRGNVGTAVNFLSPNSDTVIAMNKRFFDDNWLQEHIGELIHERQEKGALDSRVKIESVKVFPHSNKLRISVDMIYNVPGLGTTDDPSGVVNIDFEPVIDNDGILTWTYHVNTEAQGLLKVISAFEPLIAEIVDRLVIRKFFQRFSDDPKYATIIDILNLRVTTATKRWDPLFYTLHQVTSFANEININESGISIEASGAILERKREFIQNTIIRDKVRDQEGNIISLLYLCPNLFGTTTDGATTDLNGTFPATDRMAYGDIRTDDSEDLVELDFAQINERIGMNGLPQDIPYTLHKVHVEENEFEDHIRTEVRTLLCISTYELSIQSNRLLRNKRQEFRDEIISFIDDTEENQDTIKEMLHDDLKEYLNSSNYKEDLHKAVNSIVRFDLSPHEMGELQQQGILFLEQYKLVSKLGRFYYRDDRTTGEDPEDSSIDNLVTQSRILILTVADDVINPAFRLLHINELPHYLAENSVVRLYDEDNKLLEEASFSGANHDIPHTLSTPINIGKYRICVIRQNETPLCASLTIESF